MKKIVVLLAIVFLSGCTTSGMYKPGDPVNFSEESIYLIGVNPAEFSIMTWPGTIENGYFSIKRWSPADLWEEPIDGFVIGKEKAGVKLTISQIFKNIDAMGGSDGHWLPCKGQGSIAFEIPQGKVIYITSVEFKEKEDSLSVEYKDEFDKAKKFLEKHYPELAPKLEKGDSFPVGVLQACGSVNVIFI